jgi:hypothetical protein
LVIERSLKVANVSDRRSVLKAMGDAAVVASRFQGV